MEAALTQKMVPPVMASPSARERWCLPLPLPPASVPSGWGAEAGCAGLTHKGKDVPAVGNRLGVVVLVHNEVHLEGLLVSALHPGEGYCW